MPDHRSSPFTTVVSVPPRSAPLAASSSEASVASHRPVPSGATVASHEQPAPLAEVGDDSFVATVLESGVPVLVDFGAAWCPPCRVLRPVLERIAGERDDLRIVHLDTDAHPRTAAQHQILSAPTLILFRDGAPIMRLVGNRPYGRLVSELDGVLAA